MTPPGSAHATPNSIGILRTTTTCAGRSDIGALLEYLSVLTKSSARTLARSLARRYFTGSEDYIGPHSWLSQVRGRRESPVPLSRVRSLKTGFAERALRIVWRFPGDSTCCAYTNPRVRRRPIRTYHHIGLNIACSLAPGS
jgi:hypothetical protein